MKSLKEIKLKIEKIKPILKQKYFVRQIGIFGSYVTGEATEKSDLETFVNFERLMRRDFFDLQDFLTDQLYLKIDLVSIKALKPKLKEKVLKQTIFI